MGRGGEIGKDILEVARIGQLAALLKTQAPLTDAQHMGTQGRCAWTQQLQEQAGCNGQGNKWDKR